METGEHSIKTSGKEMMQDNPASLPLNFSEFDQWLDELRRNWMTPFFWGRNWPELHSSSLEKSPRIDIIDRNQEICVRAELPGVSKENLSVSLNENLLTIHALAQKEEREEHGRFHRREIMQGEYTRTLRLPCPVESEKAQTNFTNGILEISLPKSPGYQPRIIRID